MIIRHDTYDPVVNRVISKFVQRTEVGLAKYGKTLLRDDHDNLWWLKEAQAEAMDLVNYLERLIIDEENRIGKSV